MAGDLYFEDFTVGREFHTDGATVTESQILDFALAFDPQPFPMDPEAAKRAVFGGRTARRRAAAPRRGVQPGLAGSGGAALAQAGAPGGHAAGHRTGGRAASVGVEAG